MKQLMRETFETFVTLVIMIAALIICVSRATVIGLNDLWTQGIYAVKRGTVVCLLMIRNALDLVLRHLSK